MGNPLTLLIAGEGVLILGSHRHGQLLLSPEIHVFKSFIYSFSMVKDPGMW